MADEPVKQPDQTTPEEQPKRTDGYKWKTDHNRSIRQIAHEEELKAREARRERDAQKAEQPQEDVKPKETKVEPAPEPKPEVVTPKEEAPRINPDEIADKAAEKAAKKAEEALAKELAKQEETKQKEQEAREKAKEREERAKTKWQKENRLPQSYDEIYEEAKRAALEEAKEYYQQEEARKRQAFEDAQRAQQEEEAKRLKAEQEYRSTVDRMVMDEVRELVKDNVLKAPADWQELENPTTSDEAALEIRKLFEKAVEINTERAKRQEPPIVSISRIYYNYYKPAASQSTQPAGADAPIAGPGNAPQERPVSNDDRFIYARDHFKSPRQMMREVRQTFKRR